MKQRLLLILALYISIHNIQAKTNVNPVKSVLEQSNTFYAVTSANFNVQDDNDTKFLIYISDGILNIKYNKPMDLLNGQVIVYNLLGQELMRKKLESITINQVTLTVQNTCYIVKIIYMGKVHTQKVVPSI